MSPTATTNSPLTVPQPSCPLRNRTDRERIRMFMGLVWFGRLCQGWSRKVGVLGAGGLCDTSGVGQFTDVASGDYGAAYILCMRALGVSVGTGGGGFGPDQTLTRGQMASFLVRLWRDVLGRACPGGGTPFSDVAGSVHENNIACIYTLGITVGTTTTTYSPQDELTASQISRFLLRTYQKAGNNCPDRGSETRRSRRLPPRSQRHTRC